MDSAVLLYHHSPSPGFLSLPDELNYLLSLLTPDDCSFPLAHIIYTIRVMFRRMSPKSLVSRPPSRLACTGPRPFSVVKPVLLSLS